MIAINRCMFQPHKSAISSNEHFQSFTIECARFGVRYAAAGVLTRSVNLLPSFVHMLASDARSRTNCLRIYTLESATGTRHKAQCCFVRFGIVKMRQKPCYLARLETEPNGRDARRIRALTLMPNKTYCMLTTTNGKLFRDQRSLWLCSSIIAR